jgi:hypothetical protein
MPEELRLEVAKELKENLASFAAKAGTSTEKLCALVLEAWVDGRGDVYTGSWPEGPGTRLLIDWPRFASKVFKLKPEELK